MAEAPELQTGYKAVIVPKTLPFRSTYRYSKLAYSLFQMTYPEPGWGPLCVMYQLDSAIETLSGVADRIILRVRWAPAEGRQVWRPTVTGPTVTGPMVDYPDYWWGLQVALAWCVLPQAIVTPEDISSDRLAAKVWNRTSMAFSRDMYQRTYDRILAMQAESGLTSTEQGLT
jgi:hypothetical protein